MKPVLYIDDELMLCRVFEKILEQHGYQAVSFTEPELALAYLADHEVSLIVCDLRMPGITGLQVLERLPRPVPFVMVTGDLGPSLGSNPRISGVLTKPFRPEALLALVGRLVAMP